MKRNLFLISALSALVLASCGGGNGAKSQSDNNGSNAVQESVAVPEENAKQSDNVVQAEEISDRELLEKVFDQVMDEARVDCDEFLTLSEYDFEDDMYHGNTWIREDGYMSWNYYYWTMPVDNGGNLVIYYYKASGTDDDSETFCPFVYKNGKLADGSGMLPTKEDLASNFDIKAADITSVSFKSEDRGRIEASVLSGDIVYIQEYNWNGSQFVEVSRNSSLQLE